MQGLRSRWSNHTEFMQIMSWREQCPVSEAAGTKTTEPTEPRRWPQLSASHGCIPAVFSLLLRCGWWRAGGRASCFQRLNPRGQTIGIFGITKRARAPNFTLPHFNSAKQSLPVHSAVMAQAFRIRNPSLPSIMWMLFVDVTAKVVLQISSKDWGLLKSRKLAVASWSYSPLPLSSRGILKCWKQIARSLRQSVFSISKSHQNPIKIPSCFQAHMNLSFRSRPLGPQVWLAWLAWLALIFLDQLRRTEMLSK